MLPFFTPKQCFSLFYLTTGIVGDVFFHRADIAVAPVTILMERASFIDYLPSIVIQYTGLYIPSLDASESLDFHTFIAPFTPILWFVIFITTLLIALVKLMLQYCSTKDSQGMHKNIG